MELPFIIVFEPPSQKELRDALRMRGTWVGGLLVVLAIGTTVLVWSVGRAEAVSGTTAAVVLRVASQPSGASVWLDGRERGRTPIEAFVEPGPHNLLLKAAEAVDAPYALQVGADGAALEAVLWRRQPTLRRLRPTLPGAVLADVRLLSSGELALAVALPAARQLQAWRLEPRSGALRLVLSDAAGTRLSTTSDGQRVALVGYEIGPPLSGTDVAGFGSAQPNLVWLVGPLPSAPMVGWRAPLGPSEQLLDVSWSPTADRLLVVTGQNVTGGAMRSRLWFVAADSLQAQEVLNLPSEVVPGSEVWSPDGQRVIFVARAAALNALCLLDVQGAFRYVADLDPTPVAPLPYPAASWSEDSQRVLFVAPHQHPPGVGVGWLQPPDPRHALYLAEVAKPTPALTADTDVDLAVWREDGQLTGLGRASNGAGLELRLLPGTGSSLKLLEVPLRPESNRPYGALWDTARARLLIANPTASGGIDFWLVMLGPESEP
ncbi:MAG: PEGA domain-containing protein [Chloroflexi bacterium]|nr:PEGA domain-containing protein [Chloroflexota bacterium]